jgi:hypothetical protein
MMSLAAAAKAGAVCMALASDQVLFCALKTDKPKQVWVCTDEGCRTVAEFARRHRSRALYMADMERLWGVPVGTWGGRRQ